MINRFWIVVASVLTLIGVVSRQGHLVIVGLLLLVTFLFSWLWARYSLNFLHYERKLSETRVFPGETVNLTARVTNRSFLPLAWLEVDDEVRAEIRMVAGTLKQSEALKVSYLSNSTPLLWYERVSWHYRFIAERRGYFRFGPVSLRSGDPFGLFTRYNDREVYDYLIVYPRILPLLQYGLPARQPLGDRRSDRRIFEDPARTIGVRDYTRLDPFKRIHWPATARRQQLQVKVYEPTTTPQAIVFLNIATFERQMYGRDPRVFEQVVTLTASAVQQLIEERYAVGLFVNTSVAGADQPVKLWPSRDPGQLVSMLEALAKLTVIATSNFEEMLYAAGARLPFGATMVLVTAVLEPELMATMLHLRSAGHRIVVLYHGDLAELKNMEALPFETGQAGSIVLYLAHQSEDGAIVLQALTGVATQTPGVVI